VISTSEGGPIGTLTEIGRQAAEWKIAETAEEPIDAFKALEEAASHTERLEGSEIAKELHVETCVGATGWFFNSVITNPLAASIAGATFPEKWIKRLDPKKMHELLGTPNFKSLGVSVAISVIKGAALGAVDESEKAALADYIEKELIALPLFGSWWSIRQEFDKKMFDDSESYVKLRAQEDELLLSTEIPTGHFEEPKEKIKFSRKDGDLLELNIERLGTDKTPLFVAIGGQRAAPTAVGYELKYKELSADAEGGVLLEVKVEQ
jgi:hypothetical protein